MVDEQSTTLEVIRVVGVLLAPLIGLLMAMGYSGPSLRETAEYEGQAMVARWSPAIVSRWQSIQRGRYRVLGNEIPHSTQHQTAHRHGKGLTANILGLGGEMRQATSGVEDGASKVVYSLMWIIWPRVLLWMAWIPPVLLFLVGCLIDAGCRQRELRHRFFLPRLTRVTAGSWLMAFGVAVACLSTTWPRPVFLVIPVLGVLCFGIGVLLWRSIPLSAS